MRPCPARRFGGGAKMSPIYTLSGHQRTSQCENAKECQHWIDLIFSGYAGGGRQGGGAWLQDPRIATRRTAIVAFGSSGSRSSRAPSLIIVRRADSSNITCSGSPVRCAQKVQSYVSRLPVWDRRQVVRCRAPLSPPEGGRSKPNYKPAAVT